MKVHGAILSPFVRKVLIAVELKGLSYEQVDVFPGAISPEFLKISPLGKIPGFEDGDVAVCDSTVICEYLEDKYPDTPLRPASPSDRARCRWLEEYADSKIAELCGGGIFFQRIAKPMLMNMPGDEAVVEDTINNLLPPVQDYLESQVPESDFCFGNAIGIADISLVTSFINAEYAGYKVDAQRWPKLAAFIQRVRSNSVVAKCLEKEAALLAALNPEK